MAIKYNPTDFMYSSARVRALENSIIGRDKTEHMLDSGSSSDIIAALGEYGFDIIRKSDTDGDILREETLLSVLEKAYDEISKMPPDPSLTDFLRYQYDCNNIKAVIKCNSRGIDPHSMLFSLGTVPAKNVIEFIRDKKYSEFPPKMAEALPLAIEAFATSANPQQIDLIMDRACFLDMYNAAIATGEDYIVELVRTKIDLVNIITCIRILGMKLYFAAEPFMREAFLEGGYLNLNFFISGLEFGIQKLFEALEFTQYSLLSKEAGPTSPLYIVEKLADNIWLDFVKKAKYIPFGAPVLVGYLIALEYEVKNIRIILAGKDAGLPTDTIKERLRASYV